MQSKLSLRVRGMGHGAGDRQGHVSKLWSRLLDLCRPQMRSRGLITGAPVVSRPWSRVLSGSFAAVLVHEPSPKKLQTALLERSPTRRCSRSC